MSIGTKNHVTATYHTARTLGSAALHLNSTVTRRGTEGCQRGVPGDPTSAAWSSNGGSKPGAVMGGGCSERHGRGPEHLSAACDTAQPVLCGREKGGRHGKAGWGAVTGVGASPHAAGASGTGGSCVDGAGVRLPGRGNGVRGPGVPRALHWAAGTGGHRCGEGRGWTWPAGPASV